MNYFDRASEAPGLHAGIRVRVALDVLELSARLALSERNLTPRRVTVREVRVDGRGMALVPRSSSPGHLTTLLWEILAGKVAESDDTPWSDPATDLDDDVLAVLASLSVRQAASAADLVARFTAGAAQCAAPRTAVTDIFGAKSQEKSKSISTAKATVNTPVVPRDQNMPTIPAPAMTVQALVDLSAKGGLGAPPRDLEPRESKPVPSAPRVASRLARSTGLDAPKSKPALGQQLAAKPFASPVARTSSLGGPSARTSPLARSVITGPSSTPTPGSPVARATPEPRSAFGKLGASKAPRATSSSTGIAATPPSSGGLRSISKRPAEATVVANVSSTPPAHEADLGHPKPAPLATETMDEAVATPAASSVAPVSEPSKLEAGSHEAGSHEAGSHEAGSREAGSHEAGSREAGSHEAGSREAGSVARIAEPMPAAPVRQSPLPIIVSTPLIAIADPTPTSTTTPFEQSIEHFSTESTFTDAEVPVQEPSPRRRRGWLISGVSLGAAVLLIVWAAGGTRGQALLGRLSQGSPVDAAPSQPVQPAASPNLASPPKASAPIDAQAPANTGASDAPAKPSPQPTSQAKPTKAVVRPVAPPARRAAPAPADPSDGEAAKPTAAKPSGGASEASGASSMGAAPHDGAGPPPNKDAVPAAPGAGDADL